MRRPVHAILTVLCFAAPATASETIGGTVDVIDGDTVDVGGVRVRLQGIDAVETGQTCRTEHGHRYDCWRHVAAWTERNWQGRRAVCELTGETTYGREVGVCRIDGADIAGALVDAGYALAYVEYSDAYAGREAAARAADLGLWSGSFQRPQSYRHYGDGAPAPDAACTIKGNISDGGRIYHMPGTRHYDRTRIDESRGERWFCTAEDAEAAGWRAVRG